jgi:hypothetical protein
MTFPNQLVPFLRVVLQPECPAKVSPVPEGTRLIAGEPGDSQPERATWALPSASNRSAQASEAVSASKPRIPRHLPKQLSSSSDQAASSLGSLAGYASSALAHSEGPLAPLDNPIAEESEEYKKSLKEPEKEDTSEAN